MQKVKVNDQSVPKIEWKQTGGQTDRSDCITSLVNAVGNCMCMTYRLTQITAFTPISDYEKQMMNRMTTSCQSNLTKDRIAAASKHFA